MRVGVVEGVASAGYGGRSPLPGWRGDGAADGMEERREKRNNEW
jgi:hypothetical protein